MKRCIFHYPHPIADKPGIGSALRPNKMLEAFKTIGYQVDEITGYSTERKAKIEEIKRNIKNGIEYDFVYSESVNSPTVLTDADHIPRHPFADFSFLRFCKRNGIPIGLFYRDIHWKFPVYKSVSLLKRFILLPLFHYDLHMYKKFLDILYLPSEWCKELLPGFHSIPLPPGGVLHEDALKVRAQKEYSKNTLRIFYVGNVKGVYDIKNFCRAVKETDGVFLEICTPQSSWEDMREYYEPVMCSRISVVHKASHELGPHFNNADVFACCIELNEYTRLAMPIKIPEAIGYGAPILITQGIAAAEVVKQKNCGWVMENSLEETKKLLAYLRDNPQDVHEKACNTINFAPRYTWECRAQQVANELIAKKNKEN